MKPSQKWVEESKSRRVEEAESSQETFSVAKMLSGDSGRPFDSLTLRLFDLFDATLQSRFNPKCGTGMPVIRSGLGAGVGRSARLPAGSRSGISDRAPVVGRPVQTPEPAGMRALLTA